MSRPDQRQRLEIPDSPVAVVVLIALLAWALTWTTPELTGQVADTVVDHGNFQLYYDCHNRTALRFHYSLTIDTGNAKRPRFFKLDPTISSSCQQYTTMSYARVHPEYDRGHLVPANHMDDSDEIILRTNYMTNIVPQVQQMNRGIWAETETISECYRDVYPLDIYGGVIYTNDRSRDHFILTHGIRTPAYFWKVVVAQPLNTVPILLAWLIPNEVELGPLEDYLVNVAEIESRLTDRLGPIPIDSNLKSYKPSRNWDIPRYCDKS